MYNFLSLFFSLACDAFNAFLWLHFPAVPSEIMVGDFAVYIFNYEVCLKSNETELVAQELAIL